MINDTTFNDVPVKEISDIALVAYLLTTNNKMVWFNSQKNKMFFYFITTEELEKSILNFYNRNAMVDAMTFAETLRNVKSLAVKGIKGDAK